MSRPRPQRQFSRTQSDRLRMKDSRAGGSPALRSASERMRPARPTHSISAKRVAPVGRRRHSPGTTATDNATEVLGHRSPSPAQGALAVAGVAASQTPVATPHTSTAVPSALRKSTGSGSTRSSGSGGFAHTPTSGRSLTFASPLASTRLLSKSTFFPPAADPAALTSVSTGEEHTVPPGTPPRRRRRRSSSFNDGTPMAPAAHWSGAPGWRWPTQSLSVTREVLGSGTSFGGEVRRGVWCGIDVACKRVYPLATHVADLVGFRATMHRISSVRVRCEVAAASCG